MKLPTIDGEIERRLLVNYAVDPDRAATELPRPFRPMLVNGSAVAGICLLRLGQVRPHGAPGWLGVRSENAAHRFAVEWDGSDGPRTGVYIPRRDSDSRLSVAVGGRLFPGRHEPARFDVSETGDRIQVRYQSRDGSTGAHVDITITDGLRGSTLFHDLAAASRFFAAAPIGYSPARGPGRYDAMEMRVGNWQVSAGAITAARSSYFDDPRLFPPGTARIDSVLVMRRVALMSAALPTLSADADRAPRVRPRRAASRRRSA